MRQFSHFLLLLLILLITVLTFSKVVRFGFVNWDDPAQVLNNAAVKDLTPESLKQMFTGFTVGMYQPLTTLSYAVDFAIASKAHASFYHLTSLMLHLLNICLVYFLFKKMNFSKSVGLIVAGIFAFHPIQVEAVVWISARSTLLFSLFYLLALISYLEFLRRKNVIFLGITFFLFILSLLAKPSGASFFLFIPVFEFLFSERINKKTLFRTIIFAIPAVAALIITYFSRNDAGVFHNVELHETTTFQNVGFVFWSVIMYLFEMLLPLKQNVYKAYPDFSFIMFVVPIMVLFTAMYFFVKLKQHRRLILLAFTFFIIPLSVHLKFIPFGGQMMADRYAYLSVIGCFVLPVVVVNQLLHSLKPLLKNIFAIVLLSGLSVFFVIQSVSYADTWRDSISLWTHVIARNPKLSDAYYNRGCAYRDKGFLELSIKDYTEAIVLQPEYWEAYMARGGVYSSLKLYPKAIEDFSNAIFLHPENLTAYYNRANAYFNSGMYASAISDYRKFLAANPQHEHAAFSVILSMINLNYEPLELLDALNDFVIRFPSNSDGYYFRGLILLQNGQIIGCDDLQKAADMGHADAKRAFIRFCI